ncbi:hypothetical protein EX895_004098 [Sporisorium graminicola]|uniref:RGS domain-containing protein n=1 Tax=Sporisorium graminicola TaxID=280036 RepID=A0A4U7KSJ0_9BASI|nr:hypothetical protein EX895_004098 [Sporisorium graminicola]TKY87420.1 hypothetical protein EX895_004098 [Sporisorium graminicola]
MGSQPAPQSAQPGASTTVASPGGRWRSATEHDVYADNRDEDIFGWIQPDEWDTVAGPNKSNFMRGDCVECNIDQDRPAAAAAAVHPTLQSCGGPSCGYGAQCCEYSRRATHTSGPAPHMPALLLQQTNKSGKSSKIADLAKVEQKRSLGVSLVDIIHGRSCRPISLLDLRMFLHFQRQPLKRLPSYYPASDMQNSDLDLFDLRLDAPSSSVSSPTSPRLIKQKPVPRRLHHDEVDALDFLVAYERYLTKFRDQPRADRLKSPDPATCKAAVRAFVRRACKPRASSDLTALDVLRQGDDSPDEISDIPPEALQEVLARLKPTDLGLEPETQPLRVEFDRLVHRHLCSRRICILPSSSKQRKNRDSNSSSDTAVPTQQLGSSDKDKIPRLRWMVDVGLIAESDLQLCLAECDYSTHPDVLAPIADAVYAYMSQHVMPYFFISVARNLRPNTKRGRLTVGIVCTSIAIALSVLLIVEPSPLAIHSETGKIVRWWRLITAPIWCAGLGYILAYFTGLCVWLTLRGNREPDEEEEREREEIRSRISGEEVVGFDLATLQAAVDQRDSEAERETNRWMAPEIADILTGLTGQKKDKYKRQRSSTEFHRSRNLRTVEEGPQRSIFEATNAGLSGKVSMDHSFADASNAIGLHTYTEKDAALTMPAAVILHSPRKSSAVTGPSDTASRPSVTLSAVELNAATWVRPSMDRAPHSLNDLRQADTSIGDASAQAPALLRQKRVPLLNFSIGITTSADNELAKDHVDTPVLTRDALLFDPELAARVASPTSPQGSVRRAAGEGSPHASPPAVTRRKSLAHALRPLKSSGRMQSHIEESASDSPTRAQSDESDVEKVERILPRTPEAAAHALTPLDPREIAPWSAPSAVNSDMPYSARPLTFAASSQLKSRLSATTSSTAVGPWPAAPSAPKRAYDQSSSASWSERVWTAIQRGTGFAVGTEHVLDARVRRAQQMKAMRIMVYNTVATVVVVVIVVAIP